MADFSNLLSISGLRQVDIYGEIVNHIKTVYEAQADQKYKHYAFFNQVSLPLFFALNRTNLTDTPTFKQLTDDDFNRDYLGGKKTFFEHAETVNESAELILQIYSNSLDKKDPRFKDLAEKLI